MLPQSLQEPLQRHLVKVQLLHEEDLQEGYGDVYLPYAFERKDPNAGKSWLWQYVFPASKRSMDPRSGIERRHHISETIVQRAVKHAIQRAGIRKRGSCHTLRHNPANSLMRGRLREHRESLAFPQLYAALFETLGRGQKSHMSLIVERSST
jgi:integrase